MGRTTQQPLIIQGGMGVAVSSWQLARAVSQAGHLGVVSGTALDTVIARRLQDGDLFGNVRRALKHFPVPEMAERVLDKYYLPDGRPDGTPYTPVPRLGLRQTKAGQELSAVANFVEVWLAKEGHNGKVGVNFLEKVQMATPAAAYGALLADVDYVLMGAGIPSAIPALLDQLSVHNRTELRVDVDGAGPDDRYFVEIDPRSLTGTSLPPLRRPQFLAIVSGHSLAAYLMRSEVTRPDGFVVEGATAGGHNAPPRGRMVLDEGGEPVYGPRDEPDTAKLAAIGLPFWLAGGYGTSDKVRAALDAGACGVQVGTLFALCAESGMATDLRQSLLDGITDDTLVARTDPRASPTGFPFKVAQIEGTLSEPEVVAKRPRLCDLGYLRTPYVKPNGGVGYRCAAEPVHTYVRKGGDVADTEGRLCLCNGLTATVGLGQTRRDGYSEAAVVTLGADLEAASAMMRRHPDGWTATDVIAWLTESV